MSATNSTTHYSLPSFLGSDKPAWLVDWNGAMATIDSAIYEAKQAADTASASAGAVASDLATLSGTVSTQGTSISTLSDTLTTAVGNINTINSLIGNGTPTTTDQTIIGAINEINANVGDPADASSVTGDDAFEKIATLNSALSDSGWQNLTTSYTAKYRKIGKMVQIIVNTGTTTIPSGAQTAIGTLPEAFRPSDRLTNSCSFGAAFDVQGQIIVQQTNGEVQLRQGSGSSQAYGNGTITYFVD